MALLKVFMCQVILLGIYKLFLEQIFEDYLVPDELTRNGLVGFVCLLCFGIQLYTDKAADDNDEAVEDLKATSNTRKVESSKKYEPAEISAAPEIVTETIGSNTTSRRVVTKIQTTSQGTAAESEIPAKDGQVASSEERYNTISPTDAKKVILVSNSGIFASCSTNKSDAIRNGKADLFEETEVSNARTSYIQETTTIPVLNGLSEMNVCEESDDEGIEIDQFEIKESVKKVSEPLATAEVEEVIPESATDTAAESNRLLSNGENASSTQDFEQITTLKINDTETELINNKAENLKSIDDKLSNIIEEIEGKKSLKDETGVDQEVTLLSQPDERMGTIELIPSIQEVTNANSASNKAVNAPETTNKNSDSSTLVNAPETTNKNSDSSTLVNARVPSTIQKRKLSGEVCVAPITIDISFIYACH